MTKPVGNYSVFLQDWKQEQIYENDHLEFRGNDCLAGINYVLLIMWTDAWFKVHSGSLCRAKTLIPQPQGIMGSWTSRRPFFGSNGTLQCLEVIPARQAHTHTHPNVWCHKSALSGAPPLQQVPFLLFPPLNLKHPKFSVSLNLKRRGQLVKYFRNWKLSQSKWI